MNYWGNFNSTQSNYWMYISIWFTFWSKPKPVSHGAQAVGRLIGAFRLQENRLIFSCSFTEFWDFCNKASSSVLDRFDQLWKTTLFLCVPFAKLFSRLCALFYWGWSYSDFRQIVPWLKAKLYCDSRLIVPWFKAEPYHDLRLNCILI